LEGKINELISYVFVNTLAKYINTYVLFLLKEVLIMDESIASVDISPKINPSAVNAGSEKNQKQEVSVIQPILQEETVEIREMEILPMGIKELDSIFKKGVPKICNFLFVGEMSTGKTSVALKMLLATAKRGEKALYLSLHDTEEKIINILKSMDKDILNYLNSGNILVKKLDPFEIARQCSIRKAELDSNPNMGFKDCRQTLDFIEVISPSLVIVDSLSAIELCFSEEKMCYRHYVDNMFKYFEKLGIRSIFIKELVVESDLHKEFYENLLADCILLFKGKGKINLIKEYPINLDMKKKV
jgi:KaiC/GvpD/RAD55 family RecA-like ATPase